MTQSIFERTQAAFNELHRQLADKGLLSDERQRVIERIAKSVDELQHDYTNLILFGATEKWESPLEIRDMYKIGEKVRVLHPFNNKLRFVGIVCGYSEGIVDTGSPESGPGPLEERDLLLVRETNSRHRELHMVDPTYAKVGWEDSDAE